MVGTPTGTMASVLLAVLASVAGGVILLAIRRAVQRRPRLRSPPEEQFWRPWLSERELVVCATTDERKPTRTRGTGEYDIQAHQTLLAYLRGIDPEGVPQSNIERRPDDWMRNIVAIGGPTNNDVSKLIEELVETRYGFDDNRIVASDGELVRDPPTPQEADFTWDSGVLTRVSHPDDTNLEVLVVAGCWGQGTAGGMELVTRKANELWNRVGGEHFQVVYDVTVSRETGAPVTWRFDWDTLVKLEPTDSVHVARPRAQTARTPVRTSGSSLHRWRGRGSSGTLPG